MNKKLIEKLLEGKCSEEEKVYLYEYFQENGSELDNYLSEEEWLMYLSEDTINQHANDSSNRFSSMEEAIKQQNVEKRKKVIYISSSVLVLVSIMAFFLFKSNGLQQNGTTYDYAIKKDTLLKKNNTGKNLLITLPDSSSVTLFPQSEIRYLKSYYLDNRKIFLNGKADFSVAKNKKIPFIVFCNELSTTAIGTKFRVTGAYPNTEVDLYEGKVSIKKWSKSQGDVYYLVQGDILKYNSMSDSLQLIKKIRDNQLLVKELSKNKSKSGKQNEYESRDIQIENKSMKEIIEYLAKVYHVKISYPLQRTSTINMVFNYRRSQKIENILRNMAVLNGFTLEKMSDSSYVIK